MNPSRVLLVCTGNTCRSVLGEYLGREFHSNAATFESAGIRPQTSGDAANAVHTLRRTCGIDASAHAPRDVRRLDLEPFDLIVVFGTEVAAVVEGLGAPPSKIKVWNVQDPWGHDPSEYDDAALAIRRRLAKLATSDPGKD